MQFNGWKSSDNDSPARRWVRRVAFVVALIFLVWSSSLIGGDAKGEAANDGRSKASSTYRPKDQFNAPEWNSDKIYIAAATIDLAWRHAIVAKRTELCDLMKTGYRERAVRSILEGEGSYERSFKLDEEVDWYFAAQLMEVKCMRMI